MESFNYAASAITILYVEDDPVARDIASKMIPRKFPGMVLYAAENGKVGLELYKAHQPDIVITDINMPVMNGIQMANEIKAINAEANIIVISAYSDTDYLLSAIDLGINQYVLKPIDQHKLFAAIKKSAARIILERQVSSQHAFIRKLSRAVEQSPSMVVITDPQGTIEYVNPKFSEITGYAPADVVGQTPRVLKSGSMAPEEYANLWKAITSGEEWRGEFINRKKNGELYHEASSISPVRDAGGAITNYVAVKEDITARKRAEEEIEILNTNLASRAAELEVANRELESFSYMVSHDLRRPLTNINGFCQVILQLCTDRLDEQCLGFIQEIYDGTLRMNELIDTLLNFALSTRSDMQCGTVDLSSMVRGIAVDFGSAEPQRQVTFRIKDGVEAYGDAALIRVILENLLGNAWKYTGTRDAAVIEFGVTEQEGEPVYFVRDNGVGFDMKDAAKLFETFQRLHHLEKFKGNGIGLATVRRIINRHGGQVWGEGEPGKGATLFFTLGGERNKEGPTPPSWSRPSSA